MKDPVIKTKPWCPFCGQNVGRPQEPEQRKMDEFKLGECQCGAVYTSDPTGFNVGAAMVECLVAACGDNADLAFDIYPEDDYMDARLDNYDENDHMVYELQNVDGRKVRGVLYFVRLHKDLSELSERIGEHKKIKAEKQKSMAAQPFEPPAMEPQRDPKRVKKKAKKREVQKLVKEGNIDALVDLAMDDVKTLRFMQRMLYDPLEENRWAYAHMMVWVDDSGKNDEPLNINHLFCFAKARIGPNLYDTSPFNCDASMNHTLRCDHQSVPNQQI